MDPSMGHLNGILVRVEGNLNNNFQKSQMPGGLQGGDVEASINDQYITSVYQVSSTIYVGFFY